ncbi:MAG TPA: peptidylprolyl isomerase [Gammaproteobacteria bacterium]|nr:peptidylprolyl isomerase [Gammaproteobacteria bacterium]
MQIAKNTVVSIDYTLTDDSGEVLDSSKGQEPLAYLHGSGNIIPGLEEALEGKQAGEQVKVAVPPEKGYGLRNESMTQQVPRNMFDTQQEIKPGMRFHAESEHGTHTVTVTAVDNEHVTVDGNHPLAGKVLNFDVSIIEVRAATDEELSHGHVHGPHGHHH